ncbi:glycosyl hydrolase [Leptothrix discophora]|uniref:glucan endo-1,3-beta-D-glucosidase n=1 Tax=Leptothrix discophora TaxID=89 RepID=A0ABT9G2Z4_LEPDI|nr:glycosyl hydrolase [Leptothrix discophora]MDP4300861.1 glycosyl hydrolase [Leptothrix discophora]
MRAMNGWFLALGWLGFLSTVALPAAHGQAVKVGAATYFLAPRGGDARPPAAAHRTPDMQRRAAPTNQWYSALVFSATPEVLYAQPLSVKATPAGLEMALPLKQVVPTERRDVEIHYPHADPLLLAPVAFEPGPAQLAQASDWAIDIGMSRGTDELRYTVAHGSPFVSMQIGRGDVRVRLPAGAERIEVPDDPRILAVQAGARRYALFGPTGVRWESVGPTEWIARLPAGKGYLAAAALPDREPATLALFARHAYAFITDTRASWQVDLAQGRVTTTFTLTSRTMEGPDAGPLVSLYPHHWHDNATLDGRLGPAFNTVRGPLKLLAASTFTTRASYNGFVPFWPAVTDAQGAADLRDVMKSDLRNARRMMLEIGNGPYWQGKGLQRITKLLDVAEQQGDVAASEQLLKLLKGRVEDWFSGSSAKTYFHHDRALGTLVAYPEEYFSVVQMNDHHFHYGYWIRAMADIALRDPAWAAKDRWGGMVDLLMADIAHPVRGQADFPYLRNFDVYEGHSWASGIGLGASGNNQESSSEAVNAWAALIQWAEVTGDTALRDLGIYLYASEVQAIEHYWFDLHRLVFAPEYPHVEVSMLFGAKYAHNTWWTDEPRQIKGINLLPLTTASTYMGRDPAFVARSLATLPSDTAVFRARGKRADPPDIWQDIFAKYLALADPVAGLKAWERWGSVELGDTRSHALHWLLSLKAMGPPDLSVHADTALYAVFRRADGQRTHLAYNAGAAPITVRFTDGTSLQVLPRTLARSR